MKTVLDNNKGAVLDDILIEKILAECQAIESKGFRTFTFYQGHGLRQLNDPTVTEWLNGSQDRAGSTIQIIDVVYEGNKFTRDDLLIEKIVEGTIARFELINKDTQEIVSIFSVSLVSLFAGFSKDSNYITPERISFSIDLT